MFSSFGQLIGGLMQIGAQRPVEQAPLSHMEWARRQTPLSASIGAVALVACNPIIHRCRIGKITLKTAAEQHG